MWRLAGGSTEFEGRLEFKYIDGKWGSVCSANFDDKGNLNELCNELGYESILTWREHATPLYGSGDGPIYYFQNFRSHVLSLTSHCSRNNILSIHCSGKNIMYHKTTVTIEEQCGTMVNT